MHDHAVTSVLQFGGWCRDVVLFSMGEAIKGLLSELGREAVYDIIMMIFLDRLQVWHGVDLKP